MKYIKKPIIIDADQWFQVSYKQSTVKGKYDTEVLGVGYYRHPDISGDTKCKHCDEIMHKHGWIDTLEGGHIVCPGDFIITGIKGEKYPCKPDIFKETYDSITEEDIKYAKELDEELDKIAKTGGKLIKGELDVEKIGC